MPTFSTKETISDALVKFNKHAYNTGFEFKVYTSDKYCIYIQVSFDFSYYVNVDIECREVFYTNIPSNASWPDAWYANQIFLLDDDELKNIIDFREIEIPKGTTVYGIVFNIIGKENYLINGTVICTSLYINWQYPNYNNLYEL